MTTPCSLRLASEADAETLAALDATPDVRDWILPSTPAEHREQMRAPDQRYLVVEDAEGLVGYAILAQLDDPHDNRLIRRLVAARRGQGLGRALLDAAVGHCFGALGAHRCWLDTVVGNARAIRLYRRYGFVEEGTVREAIRRPDGRRVSLTLFSLLAHERPDSARTDLRVSGLDDPEPAA
jgi:RimJ/RimL family protein N-acetyltransferase